MRETKVSRKLMYEGSIVNFYRDEVLLEDNRLTQRDVINFKYFDGAIQAICIDEDDNVVMVKQFRHVANKYTISCVGGYIERNEDPVEAMKREVSEEIGAKIISFEKIGSLFPLVAYSYEQSHYFIVRIENKLSKQNLDEFENIEVVKMSFDDVYNYANSLECKSLNLKFITNFVKYKKLL